MDIPMALGTTAVDDPDKARLVGAVMHLVAGQIFALLYAAAFAVADNSSWWLGAGLGALHGFVALTFILPLLPAVHPRMATLRSGPGLDAVLEPPGLLALHYGRETPIVTLIAHVAYGASAWAVPDYGLAPSRA